MDTVGATTCVYAVAVVLLGGGDAALIYFGNKAALSLFQSISPLRRSLQRLATNVSTGIRTVGAVLLWGCVVLFVPIGIEWAALVGVVNVLLVMSLRALHRRAVRRADAAIELYAIVPLEE